MPLAIDPKTTAAVLIDLQQGIVGQTLAPRDGPSVVANCARFARALHDAGGLIVPVHVAFAASGADRLTQDVDSPMTRPTGGLPANWSELVPDIAALPAEFVIVKHQWGAFFGTELDLQLRRRRIDTIILGGIATNFGVESTLREAWQHNYSVVVAEDGCSTMQAEMHEFAITRIFPRLARIRSTDEIVRAIG